MKPGEESQTSVLTCSGRAAAHGLTTVTRFSDPVAISLLPPEARDRVERFRSGEMPKGWRDRLRRAHLAGLAKTMPVRTVAIDDAIRQRQSPQVVILGAGLDSRPWRMGELKDVIVFEVDHPDTQRGKRARVASLTPTTREIRFVPVDFSRDSLEEALAVAGHDASRPTTWVWEGVVMYLTPAEIEATLAVVARRSSPGSRLIVMYHAPAWFLILVRPLVRRLGEPLRSSFKPDAMRKLLERFGFTVVSDLDLPSLGALLAPELAHSLRGLKHARFVVADRPPERHHIEIAMGP